MMTNSENPFGGNSELVKTPLPNSTVVLVLGILSLISCCCYGIPGIIFAIIALVLAKAATDLYYSNPELYTPGSYQNLKAGKICAMVGLILSIAFLIYLIIVIAIIGIDALSDPALMQQRLQELLSR